MMNDIKTETKEIKNTLATFENALEEFEGVLEAILFAAGHPVAYTKLAEIFEISVSILKEKVAAFAESYNNATPERGILLLTYDDSCQLCSRQKFLPHIRTALGIRRNGTLSNSSIEVLAIIAYNQPVTRAYVDAVRGVDSAYAVSSLLERNLIEAVGRLDAPGRPMLYGTTADFLRCFGLSSLSDLPGVSSEEAADLLARMKRSAMEPGVDENQISIDDTLAEESDQENKPKKADS